MATPPVKNNASSPEAQPPLWRVIGSALLALIGIHSRDQTEREFNPKSLPVFVMVGLSLVLLLVVGVAIVVSLVVP